MELETTLRAKWRYNDTTSIDEMIERDQGHIAFLKDLKQTLNEYQCIYSAEGGQDDYPRILVETYDEKLITKLKSDFGFDDLKEIYGDDYEDKTAGEVGDYDA